VRWGQALCKLAIGGRSIKLFVTGGAGFIGSNFIRYWLGKHADDAIVNFDALTYAGDRASLSDVETSARSRYAFVQGDIADMATVRESLDTHRPDVIVNFAAESHNSRAIIDPVAFARTNVVGTQVLLEAARQLGIGRFHHISTCEVYGDLALDSRETFHEDSPYRPRTPYNASKAAADLMVRAYHATHGLPITITNCSNNYGPFQFPEKVIPLFITRALEDRPLPLYRQSHNRREWLHVEDHCRAIELVLREGRIGETYNVGSGDERSVEEVAKAVLSATGKPASLKTYVEDRPGHDRRYLLDHTKIEGELGWSPRIAFEDGLRETAAWYASNPSWWKPKVDSVVDEAAWAGRGLLDPPKARDQHGLKDA
jgi:dTDP-glucose 4,6-dehydratase